MDMVPTSFFLLQNSLWAGHLLLTKCHVFPVVMYGCESWTVKKAECRRIVAFELWCWRRLLRIPWTARISNQSILKEISPGCSLEGLIVKLKLQYFGHLMQRADSLEKTLMLGKIEGRRRRGRQRMRWLDGITDSMDMSCFFFHFNWGLITLQYCGGFCHTFTCISCGCTCVPHSEPPSPFHPSGSSQCTIPEHPVST